MKVTAESYGHAVILDIEGDVTEDTLQALRTAVEHQLNSEGVIDLVFNVERVTFMDSEALEYMLNLQDALAERFGQVRLLKVNENLAKILEITRLNATFETCRDASEAIKAIEP
ncbi:MAG: STAS domain-containing protein [Phycisphaerae bacterium]|nr:STAS domain-containing protein [Phycisphaerae bacterium]